MDILSSPQVLLFTLLLKVGVAASMAALLARWAVFRRVLFTEVRDSDQKVKLLLFLTPVLAISVLLRLVGTPYRLAGVLSSRMAGRARRGDGRLDGRLDSPGDSE